MKPSLYRVVLQHTVLELYAQNAAHAITTAQELWPGERILSATIAPDWND